MGKFQDLTGQKFNKLTVLRRAENRRRLVTWECRCDCGNITYASTYDLKSGNTKSCGCISPNKVIDLTGQRFHRLTVIKRAENNKQGQARWLCKCDCGNEVVVLGSKLRNGHTKSCGCYSVDMAKSRAIDITGMKFNSLTVIKRLDNSQDGYIRWLCKCDCGNEVIVKGTASLTHGLKKSCGCKDPHRLIDLTGQRFGRLTVLKLDNIEDRLLPSGRTKKIYNYLCKCDCGNTCIVNSYNLRNGDTKSCGCYAQELPPANFTDLTGQRFGKLTVIRKVEVTNGKQQRLKWECKCDCGGTAIVNTSALTRGTTKSCGCIKSNGEEVIASILNEYKIKTVKQKKYNDLKDKTYLRFDFYIPSENYLIEYDGSQHFITTNKGWNNEENLKATQRRDKMKNEYCIKNKIPLIRIPYTHLKDLCIEDLRLETSKYIINEDAVTCTQK